MRIRRWIGGGKEKEKENREENWREKALEVALGNTHK